MILKAVLFKDLLLIYLWLFRVLVAAYGLSLVEVSRGSSLLPHTGFSLRWLLLLPAQSIKYRLSSCGARTQLFQGMWDLPGPGIEPLSPALAIRFLTTRPPETLIRDQGALGSRSCSTCPAVCLGMGLHPRGAKGSQTSSTMSCRPRVTGEHKHTCVSTHRCTWVNRYYLQDTQIYSYMCNLLPQGGAP